MEASDRLQEPYPAIIIIYKSEHIKLYNKAIVGISENDRYVLTIFKWTEFYQEF